MYIPVLKLWMGYYRHFVCRQVLTYNSSQENLDIRIYTNTLDSKQSCPIVIIVISWLAFQDYSLTFSAKEQHPAYSRAARQCTARRGAARAQHSSRWRGGGGISTLSCVVCKASHKKCNQFGLHNGLIDLQLCKQSHYPFPRRVPRHPWVLAAVRGAIATFVCTIVMEITIGLTLPCYKLKQN